MIDLELSVTGHHQRYNGTLAGQRTLSSLACAHLETDEIAELRARLATEPEEFLPPESSTRVEINAELEAQAVRVCAVHTPQRSYFSGTDAAFWVAADGSHAKLTHCAVNPELWLFGPALILALARRGVYCLHASAFSDANAASVIVGNSGAGKSTLARAICQRAGAQRLSDDITPITLRAGKLYVLPRFPQLKLPVADQNLPEAVPLKRLILLNAAQAGMASVQQSLSQRAVFDALTRHTVASRLYSDADTRVWWQQLPQIIAALTDARSIRPAFDAYAPEHAMLAALDALDNLCG
jgi:hypothetical protein